MVPPLVSTGAGGGSTAIVSVRDPLPVPRLLVALSATLEVPTGPAGVPEINPEAAFTVRPTGKPDAPKLVGELVAVIWYENVAPFVALAAPLLVITGGMGLGLLASPATPAQPARTKSNAMRSAPGIERRAY
jgi:hypothetical protein